jgi:O-antigen ligase
MPAMWRRRAEIGMLIALCVFLPIYEAPKNIVWLAYAVAWGVNRWIERDFGGRWDGWDTLIAAWIASGFVVAAFAPLHGGEWRAALDIVRYGVVLWILKRSRLSEREVELVFAALIASAVVGLGMAFLQLARAGQDARLELNSVGHVNHTAIYLAIMLGVCAAWLFIGRRRAVLAVVTLLILVSLFVAASRAGVAVGLLMFSVLAAFWWPRSRFPAITAAAVLAVTAILDFLGAAEVFERNEANVQAGNLLAFRDRAWSLALETWRQHPLFGVGMDNFSLITNAQTGDRYASLFPHAHSVYLNTLAERGLIGAAPVAVVLVLWPLMLLREAPRPSASDTDWMVWGAALGAWLVTAVAGLVNTTLHHEHGLLAMMLLGLWLGRRTHRR